MKAEAMLKASRIKTKDTKAAVRKTMRGDESPRKVNVWW
jgi:hypothetical protein